jgi:hypothetical protein
MRDPCPRPVVFLGPSCPLAVAAAALCANYQPPARRGDVLAASEAGTEVIVIIDGYMIYDYPPSPREVATAAAAGTVIVGGASLGALRAVELRNRSVTGVGWVYRQYLDGHITADDEVLVGIDPRTGNPRSVPLVRIRYALARLREQGAVAEERASALLARLEETHYDDRTHELIARICHEERLGDFLPQLLYDDRYDIKRKDAIATLRYAGAMSRA